MMLIRHSFAALFLLPLAATGDNVLRNLESNKKDKGPSGESPGLLRRGLLSEQAEMRTEVRQARELQDTLPCQPGCVSTGDGRVLLFIPEGVCCPFAIAFQRISLCPGNDPNIVNNSTNHDFVISIVQGGQGTYPAVTRLDGAQCTSGHAETLPVVSNFDDAKKGEFDVKIRPQVAKVVQGNDGLTSSTFTLTGSGIICLWSSDLTQVPDKLPPGPSTTLFAGGRVVYTVDPQSTFNVLAASGKFIDVCAALA